MSYELEILFCSYRDFVLSSRSSAIAIAFGVVLAAVSASPAFAQTAENVMVVVNEASPESVRIGEYYVAKRNIPPENVTRLKTRRGG